MRFYVILCISSLLRREMSTEDPDEVVQCGPGTRVLRQSRLSARDRLHRTAGSARVVTRDGGEAGMAFCARMMMGQDCEGWP